MKIDLALNKLQRLICHKTQITNQTFDDDAVFFDIVVYVLLGDILVPYPFITCLNDVLQTLFDQMVLL